MIFYTPKIKHATTGWVYHWLRPEPFLGGMPTLGLPMGCSGLATMGYKDIGFANGCKWLVMFSMSRVGLIILSSQISSSSFVSEYWTRSCLFFNPAIQVLLTQLSASTSLQTLPDRCLLIVWHFSYRWSNEFRVFWVNLMVECVRICPGWSLQLLAFL